MMADRYFVDTPVAGFTAQLVGQEAHHLAHVMRAKAGQQVTLFDGTGAEFAASVTRVGRAEIDLEILAREQVDRELSVSIALGVALPKGDRQRWLVEKATELGVARLMPLMTERSNHRESPAALERLRRAVIEASKQCGRNRLMEITAPAAAAEFLAGETAALRVFADPGAQPIALPAELPPRIVIAVGPEGGFTDDERSQANRHGWTAVGLGSRILRVETAALAVVSAIALA